MLFKNLQSLNYVVYFLLVIYCSSIRSCRAQKNNQSRCVSSSCGNIGAISYPFRLKTDPTHCGKSGYELDCRNNQAIITFKSKTFHVESINYSNYTIRVTDPGLVQNFDFCTYPNVSLPEIDIPYYFSTLKPGKFVNDFVNLNNYVVFANCLNVVNGPQYILVNDTTCSRNSSRGYMYVIVGVYLMSLSDLPDSCSVETVSWVTLTGPSMAPGNASLAGIRTSLAYGLELSWQNVLCEACDPDRSSCILTDDRVSCEKTCFESTPYEKKSFGCKLEFLAPAIIVYGGGGIAGLLVVRFFLGLCCIGVLLRREGKRRRLWEIRHKDDQVCSFEVNAEDISK